MIRLYLKNYSDADCVTLCNALLRACHGLVKDAEASKYLNSALAYITGYIDCRQDKKKGGVKNCPHV